MIRRQLVTACLATICLLVLLGVVYPLVVTGVSQVAFADQANGSIVHRDGQAVGSALIGQAFTQPGYFHPRPSVAGDGYDPLATGGSNLGPSSDKLLAAVQQRIDAYRTENNLAPDATVPVDAVTASASGLDPDISVANADIQATRVAQARGLPVDQVLALVQAHTQDRQWGVLGEDSVRVLNLNLALDQLS